MSQSSAWQALTMHYVWLAYWMSSLLSKQQGCIQISSEVTLLTDAARTKLLGVNAALGFTCRLFTNCCPNGIRNKFCLYSAPLCVVHFVTNNFPTLPLKACVISLVAQSSIVKRRRPNLNLNWQRHCCCYALCFQVPRVPTVCQCYRQFLLLAICVKLRPLQGSHYLLYGIIFKCRVCRADTRRRPWVWWAAPELSAPIASRACDDVGSSISLVSLASVADMVESRPPLPVPHVLGISRS